MSYTEFKQDAIETQPIFYNTDLSNLEIEDVDAIKVDGKLLKLSPRGMESLRKLVRLPDTFSHRVDRYLGEKANISLLNALRKGISKRNGVEVTVSLSKDGTVINVEKKFSQISTEGYFDLVERVVDRYDLELSQYSVDADGIVTVGTKAPQGKFQIGDFKDEYFETGPSFVNRMGRLEMFNYIERMICTNGIYGNVETDQSITSLDKEDMVEFFEQLDAMAQINFIPLEFQENVLRAMKTRASLREMERVHYLINGYSASDNNKFNDWFVPISDVRSAYRSVGYDPHEMSATQKKNAPTNLSVWDLINGLTEFASHDQSGRGYNFSAHQADSMMRDAGRMLTKKTFDTENLVEVPTFN